METKEKMLTIMFWTSFAVLIIMILLYIFGDSPTFEQLLFGGAVTITLDIYKNLLILTKKVSKPEESNNWVKQSLERIETKIGA